MKKLLIILLETYTAIKRRVKGVEWDYSEDILKSKKHLNPSYLIDRWERYWRVIETNNGHYYEKFNFTDKNILELGCGPFFGWGPIALFRGASIYYYHEPFLKKEFVESEEVKKKYFVPLYSELCSNFGEIMSFSKWYDKVLDKCNPVDFNVKEQVDLVLSNSVIEHIKRTDLQDIMNHMCSVCKPESYFLHAVDFGSHGKDSFYLYNKNLDYWNKLNLLRLSEIEKLLTDSKFNLLNVTIYRSMEVNLDSIHKSWRKYSDKDLTSRVVFFVGCKNDSIDYKNDQKNSDGYSLIDGNKESVIENQEFNFRGKSNKK